MNIKFLPNNIQAYVLPLTKQMAKKQPKNTYFTKVANNKYDFQKANEQFLNFIYWSLKSRSEKTKKWSNRVDHSQWERGVTLYALDLLEKIKTYDLSDTYLPNTNLFRIVNNNMDNLDEWKHYSYSGSALCYDIDIANRLSNKSEIRFSKKDGHLLPPNSQETWLNVQARALYQAMKLIELYASEAIQKLNLFIV